MQAAFQVWGLSVVLAADQPETFTRMLDLALPDWTPEVAGVNPDVQFEIRYEGQAYGLCQAGQLIQKSAESEELVQVLRGLLHLEISTHSPKGVFIHAGLVSLHGAGLIVPGRTGSGKSVLVNALVAEGARFYSDEYAVLDGQGLAHSYPSPAIHRLQPAGIRLVPAMEMGWQPALPPVKLAWAVLTEYAPDMNWHPQLLGRGEGTLALFENTVCARTASARALNWLERATPSTTFWRGPRGEASDCASQILEKLGIL